MSDYFFETEAGVVVVFADVFLAAGFVAGVAGVVGDFAERAASTR
jgi:hypothetical protein